MTRKEYLLKIHNKAKEIYPDMKEAIPGVCENCGECCSDNVQIFKSEMKSLKKKYKKLFRGVDVVDVGEDLVRLVKRSSANKGRGLNRCIFFDSDSNKCKVYNDRPLICQLYGQSPIAACGYEGLTSLPSYEERVKLSSDSKESNITIMAEMALQLKKQN